MEIEKADIKKKISQSFNIINSLTKDISEIKKKIDEFEKEKEDIRLEGGYPEYVRRLSALQGVMIGFFGRCENSFEDLKLFMQNIEEEING